MSAPSTLQLQPPVLLCAAWVAPMTGPLLGAAGVVFRNGRIAAVGSTRSLRTDHPDAMLHDAGNAIILPGLINVHTHLELSLLQPGDRPHRFVDWIINLMGRADPAQAPDATLAGIKQCLRFGITTVGDITSQPSMTRPVLAASPLRGISFGEVRGMAQRRSLVGARISAAIEPTDSPRITSGLSPHAPYSIETTGYQDCLGVARKHQLTLTTHLAETADEAEFLRDQTGPFKELWDQLHAWDDQVPCFDGGPIRFAKSIGLLDYPTILAHMNYCNNAELDLLAGGQASVAYCPRTHAFFGHPPHRFREMLARGINVAVATDSCASSPNLNLVDDLRLLHKIAPEIAPLRLWELVTINAARALCDPHAGSLSPRNVADAVVFSVAGTDALTGILESDAEPSQVWIAGINRKT